MVEHVAKRNMFYEIVLQTSAIRPLSPPRGWVVNTTSSISETSKYTIGASCEITDHFVLLVIRLQTS